MQRQAVDPGAHVHRRRRQPDRIGRQFHHSARINSASQLAGTYPGKFNVQPRSLIRLIATGIGGAGINRNGNSPGAAGALVSRRTQ